MRRDLAAVNLALRPRIVEMTSAVYGPPTLDTPREVRWRESGALVLSFANWLWCDHAATGPNGRTAGGDLLDLVRHAYGCSLSDAIRLADSWTGGGIPAARHEAVISPTRPASGATALRWYEAGLPDHRVIRAYFRGRLGGIEVDPAWIADCRYMPDCRMGEARYPALVALVRDIWSGTARGIQRTALLIKGDEVTRRMDTPKMTLGPAKHGVVMLSAFDEPTLGLGLAEGIETGMSLLAIGWAPVWATLGTAGMRSFPVLDGIETLTVFSDVGIAGEQAAQACARRWNAAGRIVQIIRPPADVSDFNDLVRTAS